MQTVRTIDDLRKALRRWRKDGQRVALVPTMGALHAGHIALVDAARARADRVVVSIFVNPLQFGAGEDLAVYPRREAADVKLLKAAACDLLWMPDADMMYPDGFATTIGVAGLAHELDGAARPGHFDGVATVVGKLLNQVAPDIALFGEKDWQQLQVVRRMVADLDLRIEIAAVPTQRDDDGLALSSRNAYLTDEERLAARALPRALGEAKTAIERGDPIDAALELAERRLLDAGFAAIDYVALCDAATLAPLTALDREARLLAAARIGRTRLIDNLAVDPPVT